MSTAKERPQLDPDDLRQLKWLLGGLLGLLALSSLLYLEAGAWPLLAAGFLLVPLVLWRPDLPARVPAWAHRLVFPSLAAYLTYDLYAHGEPLASAVRLDALLLLYRCCHYRRRRDDLQLIVLGLFLVVMAGVATASAEFAVQIVAFAGLSLLLLFVVTLLDAHEEPKPAWRPDTVPSWARRAWPGLVARLRLACDWRILACGGGLFCGFVVLSGVLFMAIPRFQLDSGFAFDRLAAKKASTGFNDVLRFGDVNEIQQDNRVVLRIEVSDRSLLPPNPYWRMVVLDEYREGVFQMSAALKRAAFRRPDTSFRIEGAEPAPRGALSLWTFYLEPGVGRYLPLAGGFRRLYFAEPQNCRWSPWLRLVALDRDPSSMKAYRVEGMATGGSLFDGLTGVGIEDADTVRGSMAETGLPGRDEAVLKGVVAEIQDGRELSPEEFARAASVWLARRHAYSLKWELPAGEGDPLVRWLVSREPGYCELFSSSLVLLARAAGHPARVVAGFVGGEWNGDYLLVRNSEAHAWCELYLGRGRWLRVDPTNDGPRLLDGRGTEARAAGVETMAPGWAARFDRLRMLWYRRVVNFDQAEQRRLIQSVRESAEGLGGSLRAWAARRTGALRAWLLRPWSPGRSALWGAGALAGAALVYLVARYAIGRHQAGRGPRGLDPVRREAGRWLRRWSDSPGQGIDRGLEDALLRLRYGRRETWPEPAGVFRRSLRAWRRRSG